MILLKFLILDSLKYLPKSISNVNQEEINLEPNQK